MKEGLRMVVENSPSSGSNRNGVAERAMQSVQGVIRTIRSSREESWRVTLGVVQRIWSRIAEHAEFLSRFEVG